MAFTDTTEHVYKPIFKPLRDKFKPFSVPLGKFFGILGVCAAGIALAVLLGNWTHPVEERFTAAELANVKAEYENVYTTLSNIDEALEAQGITDYDDEDLDETQLGVIERAKELGITSRMTEEQALAKMPTTHYVEEVVLPDWFRFLAFGGLPAIIGFALFMEVNRTSAYKELKRAFEFQRSQRNYPSLPIDYVERETGADYFEAVLGYQQKDNG